METLKNETKFDTQFITEYLTWGDKKMVSILEKLNDDEFNHEFTELSGNIHSKTAHILSIYEFFIKILEGDPYDHFPDFTDLKSSQLLKKWREVIEEWPKLVERYSEGFAAMPVADNQRIAVEHVYFDAAIHTIHHRAQLLTFIRLLGKTTEDVSTSETNMDYIPWLFQEKSEFIYPPTEVGRGN